MATIAQRNFSSGELTPALHARVDLTKYHSGLKTCRNMTVLRHGGVTNRPGTTFLAKGKFDNKKIRLIEFVFSRDDSYILEFGDSYIRFIRNGQQVMRGPVTPDEIASPYTEEMLDGLDYAQSGDILILCHPLVHPKELQRYDGGAILPSWRLVDSRVNPSIEGGNNVYGTARIQKSGAAVGVKETVRAVTLGSEFDDDGRRYAVTAISEETGEESFIGTDAPITDAFRTEGGPPDKYVGNDLHNVPIDISPITINWDAVSGASEYNVYRFENGDFQLLGITKNRKFKDIGQPTDSTINPPRDADIFKDNEFPSTVSFHQQRLFFANTNKRPSRIIGSRIGQHRDFTTRRNIQSDDSVDFELVGRYVSNINGLIGLDNLVVLTDSGEFSVKGEGGVITPTAINASQDTYFGSSNVIRPEIIGRSALFVQRGDSIVRDFRYNFSSGGYEGNDLTVFSSHLFDGHRLIDSCYLKSPNSNLIVAREDGAFLILTYILEQEMVGWTRCDFENGRIISMASVPETGNSERAYIVVQRGEEFHIERFADRYRDEIFLDSASVFDGRKQGDGTVKLFDPTRTKLLWIDHDSVPQSAITTSDMHLEMTLPRGEVVIFGKVNFTRTSQQVGGPLRDIFTYDKFEGPDADNGVALIQSYLDGVDDEITPIDFTFKSNQVPDVSHISSLVPIGIYADGYVLHSPNNPNYSTRYPSNPDPLIRFFSYIVAGLPITSDVETLSIDSADSPKLRTNKKLISNVRLDVLETKGLFAGRAAPKGNGIGQLNEFKIRQYEDYDQPVREVSGQIEVNIPPDWDTNGSVFIRQVDPLPFTLTAITPSGYMPTGG